MPHAKHGPARTILFMGRPGSGKETQARLMSEATGFHVVSTGEKFRELREHRDTLGEHIRREYDAGRLIPNWFADYLTIDAMIYLSPEAGLIFEGSGRTLAQAELFHEVTGWLGRPYRVINLDISEDDARARQILRAKAGNRPDSDSEQKIAIRFEAYERETAPALQFFREKGAVLDVNGIGSIDDIHTAVMAKFSEM
ncbi:nucleoside monophosphate kinase [Patescibacteria group bacterium]|nr:nucleoside monophosphate kinase [Patescibacteria group bacterium]